MFKKQGIFGKRVITLIVILSLFAPIIISTNVLGQPNGEVETILPDSKSSNDDLTQQGDSVEIGKLAQWDENYGKPSKVYVNGNFMYITLGENGLLIYNITDLNPQVVVHWDKYTCNHIYRDGNFLYMSNSTGFYILDASNMNNLQIVGNWTGAIASIYDIYASGDFVYFTDNVGIKSVNITNKANPAFLAQHLETGLREFHVENGIAYIRDTDRARVVNITNPANLQYIGQSSVFANTRDVFVFNNTLYVATQTYAYLYNVTNPSSPALLSTYQFNNTGINMFTVIGNYLYIEEEDGIVVVDVSNKTQPLYYAEKRDTIPIDDISSYGNYLFIWDGVTVAILNATKPSAISEIWQNQIMGYSLGLFMEKTTLFVANREKLQILNVKDPTNPVRIGGFYDQGYTINSVFYRGGFLYLYLGGFGLKILDVKDLTNPVELGNYSFPEAFFDMYVGNEFAYFANGLDGIGVYDIFYPDYPQKVMQYQEYPIVMGLKMQGKNLFVAAGDYFHILDMSNPYKPKEVGNWTRLGAFYFDIFLTEKYAFLVCLEGFDIIDISNLAEPVKVGQFFNWKTPYKIHVDGKYAYLLDALEGIEIFDVSNVVHPKRIASFNDDDLDFEYFWARNGYIYTAVGLDGVIIYNTKPLLTVRSSLNPFIIIGGLVFFSVLSIILRKKKNQTTN